MRIEESQAILEQLCLFVAPLGRTELFWKNPALVGGRGFLENLAFEFSFLKGSCLTCREFNSLILRRALNYEIVNLSTNKVFSTSSQRRLEVLQKPCSYQLLSCRCSEALFLSDFLSNKFFMFKNLWFLNMCFKVR